MRLKIVPVIVNHKITGYRIVEAIGDDSLTGETFTIEWSGLHTTKLDAIKRIEAAIGRNVTDCEFKDLKSDYGFVTFKKHKYKYKDLETDREWVTHFTQPFEWSKNPGDKKEYSDFTVTYEGTI